MRPLLFSAIILQCNLLTVMSVIKTSDSFHVFVVDSQNNIISETGYTTGKSSSIMFKAQNSPKAKYNIMIKNDRTGKTAKYGEVKVVVGENGHDFEKKLSYDPYAFMKTISLEED